MVILIIDDSMVMRRIYKKIMVERQIPQQYIIEAEDGAIALKKAYYYKVDLFIVDWNMPRMDGIAFVKKLRSIDKYKETPVIMVTSEKARSNIIQAVSMGVTDYITKPFKDDLLWEKIIKFINF